VSFTRSNRGQFRIRVIGRSSWCFVVILLSSFFSDASAQVIQTNSSPPFYFYPNYIREQKIRSLTLMSYERLHRKKKIKMSRRKEMAELFFDEQGNAERMIYYHRKRRDTLELGVNAYRIDGKVNKKIMTQGFSSTILRYDGELRIERDSLGRVIFSQQVNNRQETNTHITKRMFSYDTLNRPVKYDYYYAYIGFSAKKNALDTIPLSKRKYIFHYKANGCLGTIEEKYTSIGGDVTTTYYKITYRDNTIIIQDNEDPSEQLPEKYYGVLKRK
jgi:hypothetical protein